MINSTQQTTFWKFLSEHSIEIPIIQRDYAQGRTDKVVLRKGFLGSLKNALDKRVTQKLDFVYGSTENNNLQPLDGQQRLTTLWLLHWYIALKTNRLDRVAHILSRFSYETRVSSREFCKQLCAPKNFEGYSGGQVVPYITNQTWFFSAWKQDPTIQAMLVMLSGTPDKDKSGENIIDGIEEAFTDNFEEYWRLLTSHECPIIFYYLDLLGLKLSDDLYIKMNARGKQLSNFENFKADLIKYISAQAEESEQEEQKEQWGKLLDPQTGIAIKMDTTWMDLFWDEEMPQVDERYYAFMNRFFWNELFIAKDPDGKYILKVGEGKNAKGEKVSDIEKENTYYSYLNKDDVNKYSGFDVYKYQGGKIPVCFFEKLILLLDGLKSLSIPECPWDKDFHFIPTYMQEGKCVSSMNQQQRIVFFALCKYLSEANQHHDTPEQSAKCLQQWMRVVWNLVSGEDESGGPYIRSTSAIRNAIEFIDSLDSHNVYQSLADKDIKTNSAFGKQCKEEQEKAKKILDDNTWEQKIIDAERHAFFKGSIRFLYVNGEGVVDWSNFEKKFSRAQAVYDKNGMTGIEFLIAYIKLLNEQQLCQFYFSLKSRFCKTFLLKDTDEWPLVNHLFLTDKESSDSVELLLHKDLSNQQWLSDRLQDSATWWILTDWRNNQYVFTTYSNRMNEPALIRQVWPIGTLRNQHINNMMKDEDFEFQSIESQTEPYFFPGLFISFKYKKQNFIYEGDDTIYLIGETDKTQGEKSKYQIQSQDTIVEIKKGLDRILE